MIEAFKNEIKKSSQNRQNNPIKLVEALKKETNISPKKIQENTNKHEKEINKTVQYLKMEIETIRKT